MQLCRNFSVSPMRPMLDFWLHNCKIMCVNPLNVWLFPIVAMTNKCTENTQFSPVQSLSHVQLFATPCIAVCQASLSITNCRSLFKLMSVELVMPSSHLILSSPSLPAFNLSQHQGLFKLVSSSHQVAKELEFQLQHQSFQWVFRTDFL